MYFFFLRHLDLKESQAAASHFLLVRCQQTMLVPINISGRFQEEFGRKDPLRVQRGLSVWLWLPACRDQIGRKLPLLWKVGPWSKMRPTASPSLLHLPSRHFWDYQEKRLVEMIPEVGQHLELTTHCGEFGCLPVFCRLIFGHGWKTLKTTIHTYGTGFSGVGLRIGMPSERCT